MSQPNNNIEDDIKMLSNHQPFYNLMSLLHSLREETIEEMHNANTKKLQQLSGRIISYDQILQMVNYESLKKIHTK